MDIIGIILGTVTVPTWASLGKTFTMFRTIKPGIKKIETYRARDKLNRTELSSC